MLLSLRGVFKHELWLRFKPNVSRTPLWSRTWLCPQEATRNCITYIRYELFVCHASRSLSFNLRAVVQATQVISKSDFQVSSEQMSVIVRYLFARIAWFWVSDKSTRLFVIEYFLQSCKTGRWFGQSSCYTRYLVLELCRGIYLEILDLEVGHYRLVLLRYSHWSNRLRKPMKIINLAICAVLRKCL